ncbi:MAG: hypothetical protein B7X06_02030 [Verrucomicrobia bacterium 21-51-4]|nr:MAG: hypothetical protein B7X06_02030 [Verrucomicrobia bacterium 21-51-4]HQU08943.1 SurA N-terminal domain-containing protein [Opitutales bacterium]
MRTDIKSILLSLLLSLPAMALAEDTEPGHIPLPGSMAPSADSPAAPSSSNAAEPSAQEAPEQPAPQAKASHTDTASNNPTAAAHQPSGLTQMVPEDERTQVIDGSGLDQNQQTEDTAEGIEGEMQEPEFPSDDSEPPSNIAQPDPLDPAPIPAPAKQQQPASPQQAATQPAAPAAPATSLAATQPATQAPAADKNWQVEFAGGIAAIVNDHVITADELKREMAPIIPQIRRECRTQYEFNKKVEALSHQVLQSLVDHMLIVDYAESKGIKIPQSYIDNDFEDFLNKQFNGDRARYQEFLKFQGKTDRQFHREIEERIIVGYMRGQQRKSQAEVSPEKIAQYYEHNKQQFYQSESVHLRQIMLLPANATKCSEIYEKLQEGSPFATLAKQYSQDDRRSLGGDWGWVDRGDIRSELANVAFNLKPKTYSSEPVDLQGTLFILYVEDKHEAGIQPLDQVRDQIENTLASQLAQEAQARWLETLRKNAYVKYYI